jgi:hypothetical protein
MEYPIVAAIFEGKQVLPGVVCDPHRCCSVFSTILLALSCPLVASVLLDHEGWCWRHCNHAGMLASCDSRDAVG